MKREKNCYRNSHRTIGCSLPVETADQVKQVAKLECRSMSRTIEMMVDKFLSAYKPAADRMTRSLNAMVDEDKVWSGQTGSEEDDIL
jgi:hypothetical protein